MEIKEGKRTAIIYDSTDALKNSLPKAISTPPPPKAQTKTSEKSESSSSNKR